MLYSCTRMTTEGVKGLTSPSSGPPGRGHKISKADKMVRRSAAVFQ